MKARHIFFILLLFCSIAMVACDKESQIKADITVDAVEGVNPRLHGSYTSVIVGSNTSLFIDLSMFYTGDYDSAAIYLNGTKWVDVPSFPYNNKYESSHGGTFDFRGVVYDGGEESSCRYCITVTYYEQ